MESSLHGNSKNVKSSKARTGIALNNHSACKCKHLASGIMECLCGHQDRTGGSNLPSGNKVPGNDGSSIDTDLGQ